MQKFLLEIFFGDDLKDQNCEILCRKEGGGSELKQIEVDEAIQEVFAQAEQTVFTRTPNPIWQAWYAATGQSLAFTEMEKLSNKNSVVLRKTIRDYVQKRRSGELKSKVKDQSDILSLFLQSPEIFTDEVIVDELIDFSIAATQTT